MKRITKTISIILSLVLISGLIGVPAFAAGPIKIVIDGKEVASEVAPVAVSGTTLVPLRIITESLGADVKWNSATREVTVSMAAYEVMFKQGSSSFTVNGATKSLDVPCQNVDGKTMIPLRALAESIGAVVNYANNTVTINYFTTMTGSIKVSGSTTVQPIMEAAARNLQSLATGSLTITVAGGGSGAGLNDTKNGANNIGMSSSSVSAEDRQILNVYEIARDAIAVIVHPSNPVNNLTKDQIKDIFTGKIANWNEVGGSNAPILIHSRETGSGTLATLEDLLLDKEKVADRATPYASAELLKNAVANDPNGIGFDSIGFVDSTVKAVSVNNIRASAGNVTNGTYPASRSLYVFTKGEPGRTEAMVIDYLRSLECQRDIVAKEGYIALEKPQ